MLYMDGYVATSGTPNELDLEIAVPSYISSGWESKINPSSWEKNWYSSVHNYLAGKRMVQLSA